MRPWRFNGSVGVDGDTQASNSGPANQRNSERIGVVSITVKPGQNRHAAIKLNQKRRREVTIKARMTWALGFIVAIIWGFVVMMAFS